MKRKSNKKLTIALLALLGVVSAGGTYAYWQGAVLGKTKETTHTVTIGTAKDVVTKIDFTVDSTGDGKHLVPAGRAEGDQVEEIKHVYTVTWENSDSYYDTVTDSPDKVLSTGSGNLAVSAVVTNLDASVKDLFVVAITPSSTSINLHGSVEVTIKITLTEPGSAADYAKIAGKEVTVNLTFAITPSAA